MYFLNSILYYNALDIYTIKQSIFDELNGFKSIKSDIYWINSKLV